ncbi:hypothetical protein Tco_1463064 [Tanacetum coccineum]
MEREGVDYRFVGCLVGLESKVMRECCFVVGRDAWLRGLIGLVVDLCHQLGFLYLEMEVACVEFGSVMSGFGIGVDELTLSSLEVLQGFSFFLQMGFTLILATFDGLDVGLLEDVIGEDDCDDDDCNEEMSLVRILVDGY